MPKYSIIIPVFNRPDEVEELLESLTKQVYKDFEVLIVEDGSNNDCKEVVESYMESLDISYYYKENTGQGFSRNFGFERAKGDWLIVFDSDCIIPNHYFQTVEEYISQNDVDAFGGPDRAHESFTSIQKAISYSMTSFFTTGGIRGSAKSVGTFHPRSFNMGIHKEVFKKTKGYRLPRKGEDIEFSIRIIDNGFKTTLIPGAFVFHKRRTNFSQFYKQLHFFGTARINIHRHLKKEVKLLHFFPSAFILGLIASLVMLFFIPEIGIWMVGLYVSYFFAITLHASIEEGSLRIGIYSCFAAFIQLLAYGIGFIQEGIVYLTKG